MAKGLVTDTSLTHVADVIRTFNGTSVQYTPAEMAGEMIDAIPTEAPTVTVSGNPAVCKSAADGVADNVTVQIEPQQDLHGYDRPWAGGNGKNLLPMTVEGTKKENGGVWSGNSCTQNGLIFDIQTDNDDNITGIIVNGTASATTFFGLATAAGRHFTLDGAYTLNGAPNSGGATATYLLMMYNGSGTPVAADEGNGASVELTRKEGYRVQIRIASGYTANNLLFRPMIRLATETDPTFEPYSNICPISGFDEVEVVNGGKNLLNTEDVVEGSINASNGINVASPGVERTDNYSSVLGNVAYIISGLNDQVRLHQYRSNKTYIGNVLLSNSTFTTNSECAYVRIAGNAGWNTGTVMIRPATETDPTFEFYRTPDTHTITLPSTVYGGELGVTEGSGEVTWAEIASYNGETLLGRWISDRDEYTAGAAPTIGAQVVYELAAPTPLTTTPEAVQMHKGTNIISADSGDVGVTYGKDLGLYIGELKDGAREAITESASLQSLSLLSLDKADLTMEQPVDLTVKQGGEKD